MMDGLQSKMELLFIVTAILSGKQPLTFTIIGKKKRN